MFFIKPNYKYSYSDLFFQTIEELFSFYAQSIELPHDFAHQ